MTKYSVSFGWGISSLKHLTQKAPLCVIVDVLSFSSAVDAACSRGAVVYPYPWKDRSAKEFAASKQAKLAQQRQDATDENTPTLSPRSLLNLDANDRLVLPSPNGATLAFRSEADCTIAACLRNASAVAAYLQTQSTDVMIVAAGERWPDDSLRPALEDYLGVGAIVNALSGEKTVDALAAEAVFNRFRDNLSNTLAETPSGQELIQRGYRDDVDFAAGYDISQTVPVLINDAFGAMGTKT